MDDKLKVVPFAPKESDVIDNVIHIEYSNGSKEIIDAEAFAESTELPSFIAFWKEEPYEFLGYRNSKHIQRLTVIPREIKDQEDVEPSGC